MTVEQAREAFKGQTPALIRMTETDGFKLFMQWVELQADHFKGKVVSADNADEWLVARTEYNSYKNMLSMPVVFLEEIKALDSETTPADSAAE